MRAALSIDFHPDRCVTTGIVEVELPTDRSVDCPVVDALVSRRHMIDCLGSEEPAFGRGTLAPQWLVACSKLEGTPNSPPATGIA
jgi:hypothetical protein